MSPAEQQNKDIDDILSVRWQELLKVINDAGCKQELAELFLIDRHPHKAYEQLINSINLK